MNCYGAKDLAASFRTVRKNTIAIAEEIGEEQYSFQAAEGVRTVGQTLTHIALSSGFAEKIHGAERISTLEGFDFPTVIGKLMAEEQVPRTKQEIVTLLKDGEARIGSWLEGLSDEFLAERVTFPAGMVPPDKSRFEMLLALKEHEMHHRGQLMLIERMLGIVPHLTREMQARFAAMQAAKATASAN
jgi:uncharacterized damage-inducible protein DinB